MKAQVHLAENNFVCLIKNTKVDNCIHALESALQTIMGKLKEFDKIMKLPTQNDLDNAARGILQIQEVYDDPVQLVKNIIRIT